MGDCWLYCFYCVVIGVCIWICNFYIKVEGSIYLVLWGIGYRESVVDFWDDWLVLLVNEKSLGLLKSLYYKRKRREVRKMVLRLMLVFFFRGVRFYFLILYDGIYYL